MTRGPQPTRGVTRWQRWAWAGIPALLLAMLAALPCLTLATWLSKAILPAPGVPLWPWVTGAGALLLLAAAGLRLGRRACYLSASANGPWVVVEAGVGHRRGRGYAGYLCDEAGVARGHVYGTYADAYRAAVTVQNAYYQVTADAEARCRAVAARGHLRDTAECHGHCADVLETGRHRRFGTAPYYE